jgi:tRNA (guanine-N7-)-methyltransferase
MSRTKTSGRVPKDCEWQSYFIEPAGPLRWAELFGNDHPVEVEIGSGKGLFLISAAMQTPSRNFLGIEIACKFAQFTAGRLAQYSLSNARIARVDARLVFAELLDAASVASVHIYFPDPWWKRRHKKRRLFTDSLVHQIARALTPGGQLRIASDVEEYFLQMQALIAARAVFQTIHDVELEENRLTNFERKYRLAGKPIWRCNYRLLACEKPCADTAEMPHRTTSLPR